MKERFGIPVPNRSCLATLSVQANHMGVHMNQGPKDTSDCHYLAMRKEVFMKWNQHRTIRLRPASGGSIAAIAEFATRRAY